MPHQVVEYSANLDAKLDIDALLKALHDTATGIDALPTAGIRTRAVRRDHYLIADCHPDNAFIAVTLRLAEGRTMEQKKGAGAALFATLQRFVAPISENTPLSLAFEIQEIKSEMRWKAGNIRDFMVKR